MNLESIQTGNKFFCYTIRSINHLQRLFCRFKMLSFYRHSRKCCNYSHKLFTSVLGDISNPSISSNSGHRSVLQDVFSSKTTTAVHQICRNLSTGKKIDAANSLNDSDKIKKTCLYEFHVSQGGKMVDFAGYSLPIQYGKQGIAASHKHTR